MVSAEVVELVNGRTNLTALIETTVALKKHGRSALGICPFCHVHDGDDGALNVNTERGWFYCFGCKQRGRSIDWVMKTQGLSFQDAVLWLIDRLGDGMGA